MLWYVIGGATGPRVSSGLVSLLAEVVRTRRLASFCEGEGVPRVEVWIDEDDAVSVLVPQEPDVGDVVDCGMRGRFRMTAKRAAPEADAAFDAVPAGAEDAAPINPVM